MAKWTRLGALMLAAALGTGAALAWGQRRLRDWESLEIDQAHEGSYLTLSDGTLVHYVEAGRGEPVVLLHGFLDSSATWRWLSAELAPHFHVYAVDLPGFGFSARPRAPGYTVERAADWVAEFMDRLRLSPAHIVGHSMGGAIALRLAQTRPDLLAALVLEDPWVYRQFAVGEWIARAPRPLMRGLVGLTLTNGGGFEFLRRWTMARPPCLPPEVRGELRRWHRVQGTVDGLLHMAPTLGRHRVAEGTERVKNETLIIWGARDWIFPAAQGERLARELRAARLEVLPETGHSPHLEAQVTYNRIVVEFLLSCAPPSPCGQASGSLSAVRLPAAERVEVGSV